MIDKIRVNEVFLECLFLEEEVANGEPILEAIIVEGINGKVGFCRDRILFHKDEISRFIDEFPESFYEGDCFENIAINKEGDCWCTDESVLDELFMLGTAIGRLELSKDNIYGVKNLTSKKIKIVSDNQFKLSTVIRDYLYHPVYKKRF